VLNASSTSSGGLSGFIKNVVIGHRIETTLNFAWPISNPKAQHLHVAERFRQTMPAKVHKLCAVV